MLYSLSKTIFDYRKRLQFYQQYQKEYEEKFKKNQQLKTDIIKSQDTEVVERNIRNRLNLAKPDEVVIIIPIPTHSPTPTPTPYSPVFKQWIKIFF